MSNAEQIGLPFFIGWLVNGGPLVALVAAWFITPVMLYLVKWVFESKVPFRHYHPWYDAFRGFMPGDLFLGVVFALSVQLTAGLDSDQHWYNSGVWHVVVLIGAVIGGLLARKFLDGPPVYNRRQMRSPSKLYHDIVLYMGFGYLLFTVGMSALVGTDWDGTTLYLKIGMITTFVAWIVCLISDATAPLHQRQRWGEKSHPSRWRRIWR